MRLKLLDQNLPVTNIQLGKEPSLRRAPVPASLTQTLEEVLFRILIKECYSFINRFLVKNKQDPIPHGSNKLRISKEAFRTLIFRFQICPSFVLAVSQHYLPSSQFSAFLSPPQYANFSEIWYLLPVRIQVKCTDQRRAHATSPTGSNQMNPFHYLHLEDTGVDIRGSRIAIFFRYCKTRKCSKLVAVNFMDGRWSKPVEEPKMRIMESLQFPQLLTEDDHFFPHVIYASSVLRWWINALTSVHDQLIIYVRTPYHPNMLRRLNQRTGDAASGKYRQ